MSTHKATPIELNQFNGTPVVESMPLYVWMNPERAAMPFVYSKVPGNKLTLWAPVLGTAATNSWNKQLVLLKQVPTLFKEVLNLYFLEALLVSSELKLRWSL